MLDAIDQSNSNFAIPVDLDFGKRSGSSVYDKSRLTQPEATSQGEWFDAVVGHVPDDVDWADALDCMIDAVPPAVNVNISRNSELSSQELSVPSKYTSGQAPNHSDCTTGKLLQNMSEKTLSHVATSMLSKGPNFALSRSINRHVIRDAEIGLERGAFALRWREHIEQRAQDRRTLQHPVLNTEADQHEQQHQQSQQHPQVQQHSQLHPQPHEQSHPQSQQITAQEHSQQSHRSQQDPQHPLPVHISAIPVLKWHLRPALPQKVSFKN